MVLLIVTKEANHLAHIEAFGEILLQNICFKTKVCFHTAYSWVSWGVAGGFTPIIEKFAIH